MRFSLPSLLAAALGKRRDSTRSRRRSRRRTLLVEHLQDRALLAAVTMTGQEQLLLELINRARANPTAEAARYAIDLNAGLAAGTITTTAKQALAPNQFLVNAAGAHSQDMLNRDYFSHTNLDGQSPSDRARAAGYPTGVGENIAWGGSTGSINQNAHVYSRHESLFRSAGHRRNMLSAGYREIGTGVRYGVYTTGGRGYNASMVTEKFGNAGGNSFLTGVAFDDSVIADNFYTIGEAVNQGTVTATHSGGSTYQTQLGASGGYSLQIPNGSYTVSFSGTSATFEIVISGANVKLDFNTANLPAPAPPAPDPPAPDPPAPDPPAPDPPAPDPPAPAPPTPDPTPDPANGITVDDGDAAFLTQGAWSQGGIVGAHGGGYRFHAAGGGSNVATWSFQGLSNGNYEVFATWISHANRASNASFAIWDGNALEQSVEVNQRLAPDDDEVAGARWERLGIFAVENGSLRVELTDDANGYVIADAVRIVATDSAPTAPPPADPPPNNPPPPPPAPAPPTSPTLPIVLDDADTPFQRVGDSWGRGGITGAYGGGYQFHRAGNGSSIARWTTLDSLASGEYEVWATWVPHANRASNAPFTIRDGNELEERILANQQVRPDDSSEGGRSWERLGRYRIDNGQLMVELTDDANGIVIADAIRVTAATPAPPTPAPPTPAPPTPAPPTPAPPTPAPPAPAPPDPTPAPPSPPSSDRVIDDGDSGYVQEGDGWRRGGLAGSYGGDYRFHAAGNGSNRVRWTFDNLATGNYEVFTTWMHHANRASNAPFSVYDGSSLEQALNVNQRLAPTGASYAGRPWQRLGTFSIENGQMQLELSDAGDGFVIADAVRIVAHSAPPTPPPTSAPERVLDDSETGYSETGGGWSTGGLAGANQGDYRFHRPGSGGNRTQWSFENLAAGQYQVFGTWVAHANRASNAPFTIRDGTTVEAIVRANQRHAPSDALVDGQVWESLGTYQIDNGTLTVELSDDANGIVIADAIRLVSLG